MAFSTLSAKYIAYLLLAWHRSAFTVEAASYSLQRKLVRSATAVEVQSHSQGQASHLQIVHANRSGKKLAPSGLNVADEGHCATHSDCAHTKNCDMNGTHGCPNRCLYTDYRGLLKCMTKKVGEICHENGECVTGSCDLTGLYGCTNLCLSDYDSRGRHCNNKDTGEPCDDSPQCKSGVCDTQNFWGCRDLCVSELDAAGKNRQCSPKLIGETCAHHENCDQGACDLLGDHEEHQRCRHKCVTRTDLGTKCPKSHCSPGCNLCLADLMLHPLDDTGRFWKGYPTNRVQRYEQDQKSFHLRLTDNEATQLRLRIPASCIQDEQCVEVKGTIQVNKLNGASMRIQSGLFTGFPGTKPNLDAAVNGACPMRSDGYPVAGDTGCCYSPDSVGSCASTPYSKQCEGFYAGSIVFGENDKWAWEKREDSSPDSFNPSRTYTAFPSAESLNFSAPEDFNMQIDFSSEEYKYFRFGSQSFTMHEPLMKFNRDRNCNHIQDWPEASFEFSVTLLPPTGVYAGNPIDAAVLLSNLEISRKTDCSTTVAGT